MTAQTGRAGLGRPAGAGPAGPRLGPFAQYALLAGPLLSMLDSSIVNVAVEPIARQLHANLTTVQWTISGYLLALGTGDRKSTRLNSSHVRLSRMPSSA